MWYVLTSMIGMLAGGLCMFLLVEGKRRRLVILRREQEDILNQNRESLEALRIRREEQTTEFELRRQELVREKSEFDKRVIVYDELAQESVILKRDLKNVSINLRKLELDRDEQGQDQARVAQRTDDLGGRYLKDHVKWISNSLTSNNFARCKERLQKAIDACRGIGFEIPEDQEGGLIQDLRDLYEKVVRVAFEREEQARIKAQIREEQRLEKEIDRELKRLDRERAAIQAALEKALAEAKDEHSSEIEALRARLAEAEEKSQRAMSQAQLTKAGHVYVISNIGSFGEDVFKIGMTRRLEPLDRVKELGDASVPFPFDIHMMISSEDAPALENAVHKKLHTLRVNKANPRKEFFRVDFETIHGLIHEHHGEVEYVADAEALQYRQSLDMSDEDFEFIEKVYDKAADDGEFSDEDV